MERQFVRVYFLPGSSTVQVVYTNSEEEPIFRDPLAGSSPAMEFIDIELLTTRYLSPRELRANLEYVSGAVRFKPDAPLSPPIQAATPRQPQSS